ncbi:OmpA family protein [Megalodesulfovibrio paquesii]
MMRIKGSFLSMLLMVACVLAIAMPAEAKWKKVPKVDNFIFFQDHSGSMAMHMKKVKGDTKIVMSKQVMAAMNDAIPDLGYNAGLDTFAPFKEYVKMGAYDKTAMSAGIEKIKTEYPIFQRLTPMGPGLMELRPVLDSLSGKTAIFLLSDGEHNKGIDPVAEATAIYNTYPNVCFHVVSFADSEYGKSVLEAIAALNDCSCGVVEGTQLRSDATALENFVKCALYDLVNVCDGEVIMFRSIQFDFDKSNIKKEMMPILDEAANIIKENDCNYEVAGHTCNIGTEKYNQGLSERRAASVVKYLSGKGVDASKLRAVGYGELKPKHDNKTREGRRLNRRVEIRVLPE